MIGKQILYLLVFPGLLFTCVLGLLIGWLDRKVSASFQFRVGPPIFQNFNDIFKLLGKEVILIKDTNITVFALAPIAAFSVMVFLSMSIGLVLFYGLGFGGDIIVMMYLFMFFSVAIIIGGSASGNVLSSLGAGREIKLLLADELAFILICLIPIIKSGYLLGLNEIVIAQSDGAFIGSISGFIGFLVGLLCIQAKMTLPPFHIPEAETELAEGPLMEYSGPLLALWKICQHMMWVIFPFFLIILFFGGFNLVGIGILWAILKYVLIIVLMIIIKNTNPRIQIDTALKFFWRYASPLALIGIILAVLGV